jgi:hypothetical protein
MYPSNTNYPGAEDCIVPAECLRRLKELISPKKCDTGLDHAQNPLTAVK